MTLTLVWAMVMIEKEARVDEVSVAASMDGPLPLKIRDRSCDVPCSSRRIGWDR